MSLPQNTSSPPNHHLILLPIHSSVDLITNSSSELFMLPTSKTENAAIDMFTELATIFTGVPTDPFSNGWLSKERESEDDYRDSVHSFELDWDPPPEFMKAIDRLPVSPRYDVRASIIARLEVFTPKERAICRHLQNAVDHVRYGREGTYDPTRIGLPPSATLSDVLALADPMWVKLMEAAAPATEYIMRVFPELTREQVEYTIVSSMQVDREYLHPIVRAEIIAGRDTRWLRDGPVGDLHDAFYSALRTRGMSEQAAGYFIYHWYHPLKGKFIAIPSAEDNSVPYGFMNFLRETIPGLQSWHMG